MYVSMHSYTTTRSVERMKPPTASEQRRGPWLSMEGGVDVIVAVVVSREMVWRRGVVVVVVVREDRRFSKVQER